VTELLEDFFPGKNIDGYPYPGGDFVTYLHGAPVTSTSMETLGPDVISVSWSFLFSGNADTDFGVFFDANCDGSYAPGDNVGGTAASTGANPETLSLDFPAEGCYWIHAAGFDGPGSFDETRQIQQIGMSPFTADNIPLSTIPPMTVTTFDLGWDFLGSTPVGSIPGSLFVSPGYAPFSLTQKIAIDWLYDTEAPIISDMLPTPGSVTADAMPTIVANIWDNNTLQDVPPGPYPGGEIDWRTAELWVDGEDWTQIADVIAPFDDDGGGYFAVTVAAAPTAPLADGPHTAQVMIRDSAGNLGQQSWTWWVDTTAPDIMVTAPVAMETTTNSATAMVSGTTEPGATLSFDSGGGSQPVMVDSQGLFSDTVSLVPGRNDLTITATDALGNSDSMMLVIWSDTDDPAFDTVTYDPVTNEDFVRFAGMMSEASSLMIAGMEVVVNADMSWTATLPLAEGTNTFTLTATDEAGNTVTRTESVMRISAPPTLSAVARDATGAEVLGVIKDKTMNTAQITGTTSAATGAEVLFVTVNGRSYIPDVNGAFESIDFDLNVGANVFSVQSVDDAGNIQHASVTVSYNPVTTQVSVTESFTSIAWAAVAFVLLAVGFLVGMMLFRGGKPEAEPPLEPMEEPMEPAPEETPPMEEEPMESPPEGGGEPEGEEKPPGGM
jgi:hypothetical protein